MNRQDVMTFCLYLVLACLISLLGVLLYIAVMGFDRFYRLQLDTGLLSGGWNLELPRMYLESFIVEVDRVLLFRS